MSTASGAMEHTAYMLASMAETKLSRGGLTCSVPASDISSSSRAYIAAPERTVMSQFNDTVDTLISGMPCAVFPEGILLITKFPI